MNQKQKERSYEYYVQWQENKSRYRAESAAYTVVLVGGILFVLNNISAIMLSLGILLIICSGILMFRIYKRWNAMRKAREELMLMASASGAKNIEINPKTKQISLVIDSNNKEAVLKEWKQQMNERGFKMTVLENQNVENGVCDEVSGGVITKTTEVGYINRNNQRNNGRLNEKGSDNNQWFYEMECLDCGEKYKANGSDIFQRKCPKCQKGRP